MLILEKELIEISEKAAVANSAFSFKELMLTAGTKAAEFIASKYPVKSCKIAVLCGTGNNGGDGCVIADFLAKSGADVTVIAPFGIPKTENAAYYYNSMENVKIADQLTDEYDIIIDALFGIGFHGEPSPKAFELFEKINQCSGVKISIDIPSGVECDNGSVYKTAVIADLTLAFIAYKPCFFLPQGNEFCGEVCVLDIGVTPVDYSYKLIEKPAFPKRRRNSHKGTFGTALLFVGSFGMAGAAMLATKAALRSGLGIAKCVIPKSIYRPLTVFVPEAVCIPSEEAENGVLDFEKLPKETILENCTAVLCGCGNSQSDETFKIVEFLLENSTVPIILDADGINVICDSIELLKNRKAPLILTPHPGEMARLCKTDVATVEKDRIGFAKRFATEYQCTLVLKGSNTIVALSNGDIFINNCGNAGMATGGSGDVLAGIIVSLAAQGFAPETAAKYAVYLHSAAGDKAAKKRSMHALLPTDIIEEL